MSISDKHIALAVVSVIGTILSAFIIKDSRRSSGKIKLKIKKFMQSVYVEDNQRYLSVVQDVGNALSNLSELEKLAMRPKDAIVVVYGLFSRYEEYLHRYVKITNTQINRLYLYCGTDYKSETELEIGKITNKILSCLENITGVKKRDTRILKKQKEKK